MAQLSPMIQQYLDIKKEYDDTLVFFRLGDFYEMFFNDAITASKALELTLTSRNCGQGEKAPMCGVPYHSADNYIARLVKMGYKVAICEQLQDPSETKGIVERGVTRIVTKGSIIENHMLDESRNNYLTSIFYDENGAGVCFTDVSTGTMNLTHFVSNDKIENNIINELGLFSPSEVIINSKCVDSKIIASFITDKINATCETEADEYFSYDDCLCICTEHFGEPELISQGLKVCPHAIIAAGVVLKYLKKTQQNSVSNIRHINFYSQDQFMKIDYSTKRNLEILETMRNGDKKGSLLWVLDKTKTSMGKRQIRSWLEKPLLNIVQITKRQSAVSELYANNMKLTDLRSALNKVFDIERLITRVVFETANCKDLNAIKQTIETLPEIKTLLADSQCAMLKAQFNSLDNLEDVFKLIDGAIKAEAPFSVREGDMINDGYNAELDELRNIQKNAKQYLAKIEQDEREKTGIPKLKIGYNKVFGYYIEISNAFKHLAPEEYIRKQTLSNCERFITQELKELESKVLGSQERIYKLEFAIFSQIRKKVGEQFNRIQLTANALASIDVLASFADVALNNGYNCPVITDDTQLKIVDGRHPVVELVLSDSIYVPNDTDLNCEDKRCSIITGPNMAGKSTYMRQVAVISLMAQVGSFVPAKSATLGIVDAIYTRVGASDDLATGQSTFMVEMNEVATILSSASKKSLVILDEVGRGTSTFDGMSIAQAVLEYLANKKKVGAKTLFSTHYHELTELEGKIEGIKNYNISVRKTPDNIVFLRKIIAGPASGSYGIDVANLAGVPKSVVNRARIILKDIETHQADYTLFSPSSEENIDENAVFVDTQASFQAMANEEVIQKLISIDVNTLTPLEALTTLHDIINKVKNTN